MAQKGVPGKVLRYGRKRNKMALGTAPDSTSVGSHITSYVRVVIRLMGAYLVGPRADTDNPVKTHPVRRTSYRSSEVRMGESRDPGLLLQSHDEASFSCIRRLG